MIKAITFDGKEKIITPAIKQEGSVTTVTVSKMLDTSDIKYIDFEYMENIAESGDEGYMVGPNEGTLTYFKERKDTEYIADRYATPVYGVKKKDSCFVAIVKGMAYNYLLVTGVKGGKYYIYPRFNINGDKMYEDIVISLYSLEGEDANYSGMARCYRAYQLERGECVPLAERLKDNPELKYTSESIMIRIRNGWKPCKPPVLEQTPETEPEMHVAIDFERVGDILDELKKQGIEKAEICLVGWNTKGHDGRWPQCFPVAEELGGEEKLRELIKKAQNMGYQIVCHSNSTDTYSVSELWNEDDLIINKDGSRPKDDPWSGGQMYQICPKIALEQAKEILPKIAGLGFKGTHYIDVLNIVMPRSCYNDKHPVSIKDAVEIDREIMKMSQELFGAYSSEGGYDFGAKYQDFALNIDHFGNEFHNPLLDEKIPFWQLVYHGIIVSNPNMHETLNFSCKKDGSIGKLRLLEYGGRPTYYYNTVFCDDWQNNRSEDLICDNDELLEKSVSQIKEGYELNKILSDLQTSFMESHEKLEEGVYRTTYSNGIVITVDYNKKSYTVA